MSKSRYGKVTIYKQTRNSRDCFTVAWYVGSRRIRETTSDFGEAETRAKEILASYANGNVPREPMKRKAKSKQSYSHLIGNVSMDEVVKYYAQNHGLLPTISVENVVKGFLAVKMKSGISERYRQSLQQHLNKFCGTFGHKNISTIVTEDVDTYLLAFSDMRTRFNHRVSLRSLFKWAKGQNYITQSVADNTEVPKFKVKTPELFSPDELKKLLAVADERSLPMLIAGAYSGVRMSEIQRLRWTDVNWDEKAFVLSAEITKTNRKRLAYFPDSVVPILKNLAVLARLRNCEKFMQDTSVEHLNRLSKAAGVPWKRNGLRKTYISCRIALTRNAAEIAEQCGNSPNVVQHSYKGLVTKSEAENWFNTIDLIHVNHSN